MQVKIQKWTDLLNYLNDNKIRYVWNDNTETLLVHRVDVTGYKENK
jgi:hypothetical protein